MSFPLPTGFDPSKMMEYLASLPEDKQTELLQSAMGRVGEFQQQAQQTRTRDGLIKRFQDARARFVRPGGAFAEELGTGQIGPDGVQLNLSNTDAKPNLDMRSLKTLKPMIGKELVVGTTHRGRYLCGWVAIEDAFFGIASSSLLLEDVTGQLVEIAAYGLVDPDLPPHERQYALASRFPKGQPIVVFEPYFKVRQDMSEGIRVEQPKEMIPWKDVPKDLEAWKKLGNEYFSVLTTENEGRGALACYARAIEQVKGDAVKIAVLLNNIATCRFKTRDFKTAIQLAGAAVHLDPTYVKGWFRLASALLEDETQNVKQDCRVIAERVIAHACSVIPHLTTKERRLLEGTLKSKDTATSFTAESSFRSYVEWCAKLGSPGFLLLTKEVVTDALSAESKDADAWRKAGAEHFTSGDFHAAEECYLKEIAGMASCCRDIAPVLNNIAAVHLMLHREASNVPGISVGNSRGSSMKENDTVPDTEAALLSATVAGIIDPLNFKAWTRRARCMQRLEYTQEECIADLNAIRASIVSKAFSSSERRERVQEFKQKMRFDVQQRSAQPIGAKAALKVSNVPTDIQREQRDALLPDNIAATLRNKKSNQAGPISGISSEERKESIDEYIARMEAFEQAMRFGFAASKSKSSGQQKDIPREMMMFVNHPPPQIHAEFPKLRGWPDGLDTKFAQKVLHRAYLDASASPWVIGLSMRDEMFFKNMDPGDLIKRWHGTAALEVLQAKGGNLRLGDIIDGRGDAIPEYDARIRSNFANNPNRAEVYFFGSTHVAIGFNDFSSLLSATIQEINADSHGPLRFVGFEMSEFAVAKCKVIAHMLAFPTTSISSIMEVWLSSTWNETTLNDFRKSVKAVLDLLQERNENPTVISYLKHWASAEAISASKARSEFFLNMERYNEKSLIAPFCFRREIDRLDLTQYMLTGEVRASTNVLNKLEKEIVGDTIAKATASNKNRKKKKGKQTLSSTTPLVGSLTMWNVPPGAPPLEEDVAFNTVEFMTILEAFVERQNKQKNSVDRLSMADLFMIHVMENLHRLRGLMLANKLIIAVSYGVVKAVRGPAATDSDNLKLLNRIANLRPYTISWSNVLDYFLPEDFHDLARRCSVHGDCMHYGYSMNWPTQVYGASIIDYSPEDCKQLIDTTLDTAFGFPTTSGSSMPSSTDMFTMMGLDRLVLFPMREHPLNSTGYVLAHVFKKYWIDHFMNTGKLTSKAARKLGALCTPSNSGMQMGTMDISMPSPLYRTSLTLYMSWCYDPELRLQGANNPLELGVATDRGMLEESMQHLSVEERQELWKEVAAGFYK